MYIVLGHRKLDVIFPTNPFRHLILSELPPEEPFPQPRRRLVQADHVRHVDLAVHRLDDHPLAPDPPELQ